MALRRRTDASRQQLVSQLGRYLDTQYYPRFGLLVIVTTSGLAGFLTSALLLDRGWTAMASRYAIASLVAYLLFLLLVRLWARYYRYLHPDGVEELDAVDVVNIVSDGVEVVTPSSPSFEFGGGGDFSGGGAGRSFGDVGEAVAGAADLDEGIVWLAPLLIALALVVGLISAILVIAGAPMLLGEVLLDAGIAGLIYRRVHNYSTQHWLSGVVRRTWKPMLAVVTILVIAAAVAQHLVPVADSIGDFFGK